MWSWRMPNFGVGEEIPEKLYMNKHNQHKFEVISEQHENHPIKILGYRYWKIIGEVYYPTEERQRNLADEETEAGTPDPDDEEDLDDKTERNVEEKNEKTLYNCPEPGCKKQYQFYGNLERHATSGQHEYSPDRETMQDVAQGMYLQKLEELHTNPEMQEVEEELYISQIRDSRCNARQNPLPRGWALKGPATNVRFNKNQLEFLDDAFDKGESTRLKSKASDLVKEMKKIRTADGELRFSSDEYLKEKQIMNYFSRKSRMGVPPPPIPSHTTPPPKKLRTEGTTTSKPQIIDIPEALDDQVEAEHPSNSDTYVYVRSDEWEDDEQYDNVEDEMWSTFNKECVV